MLNASDLPSAMNILALALITLAFRHALALFIALREYAKAGK